MKKMVGVSALLVMAGCGGAPGGTCAPGWAIAVNAAVCCPDNEPYAASDGFCWPSQDAFRVADECYPLDGQAIEAMLSIIETARLDGYTRADALNESVIGCASGCTPGDAQCGTFCTLCVSAVVDAVY